MIHMFILVIFLLVSVPAVFQDIRAGEVSRYMLWGGLAAALLVQALGSVIPFIQALGGAALGCGVFLSARFITHKKLGLADVWYAGFIGAVLGPFWFFPAIMASCVLGIISFAISRNKQIPFIPCMAFASAAVMAAKIVYEKGGT